MDFFVYWLPPVHSKRNGIIRSYSIILTLTQSQVSVTHSVAGNITSFYFQNLHPAYIYEFEVAAVTISQGPYSDVVEVKMEEDGMYVSMYAA